MDSAARCLRSGLAVHVAAGRIVAVCPPEQVGPDVQALDVTWRDLLEWLGMGDVAHDPWGARESSSQ